jgi:hypothetical protein
MGVNSSNNSYGFHTFYPVSMTCPPKTDPKVVLGSVHTGGRKDGNTDFIRRNSNHRYRIISFLQKNQSYIIDISRYQSKWTVIYRLASTNRYSYCLGGQKWLVSIRQ